MSIQSRLAYLERMFGSVDGEDAFERIPIEWGTVDAGGNLIGPSDDATLGQLRTWRMVDSMLGSVPYVPLGD
jgi:hypothetical protein